MFNNNLHINKQKIIDINRKLLVDTEYLLMDANWQYGEEGRWWQRVRCSCYRVGDPHSTDVSGLFSLLFIRFFLLPSPLKPCGYCTCLIMMKHVPFSPNLSAVAWYVLRNDLRDLRSSNWPFLLQFEVAGDGSTKTNIKINTKWLWLAAILPAW